MCHFATDTCLNLLLDFIKDNMTKGLYTRLSIILLGLQKAFENVYHVFFYVKKKIKLKRIGITNSEWFESYLSNRKQNSAIRKCCAYFIYLGL